MLLLRTLLQDSLAHLLLPDQPPESLNLLQDFINVDEVTRIQRFPGLDSQQCT